MGLGQSYATPENDPYSGEKGLRTIGVRDRGVAKDFFMYSPRYSRGTNGLIRCGICGEDMTCHAHCPRCYPDKKEEGC